MQPEVILNAIGGGAARRDVRIMGGVAVWEDAGVLNDAAVPDVATYVDEAGGWGEVRCTDGCCRDAGWDEKKSVETGAETGARRGAGRSAGGLGIFEGVEAGVGRDAEEIIGGLEISSSAVWDAETSERADEGAEAAVGGLEIFDGVNQGLGISERADGENFRNFIAAACAIRSFFSSSIHLIFGDVKCSSPSHFRISFFDHAVRSLFCSTLYNVAAIGVFLSTQTPRCFRKSRSFRVCWLLIRLKSFFV